MAALILDPNVLACALTGQGWTAGCAGNILVLNEDTLSTPPSAALRPDDSNTRLSAGSQDPDLCNGRTQSARLSSSARQLHLLAAGQRHVPLGRRARRFLLQRFVFLAVRLCPQWLRRKHRRPMLQPAWQTRGYRCWLERPGAQWLRQPPVRSRHSRTWSPQSPLHHVADGRPYALEHLGRLPARLHSPRLQCRLSLGSLPASHAQPWQSHLSLARDGEPARRCHSEACSTQARPTPPAPPRLGWFCCQSSQGCTHTVHAPYRSRAQVQREAQRRT